MDKVIQAQLRDIEEKNNVKILYAIESEVEAGDLNLRIVILM